MADNKNIQTIGMYIRLWYLFGVTSSLFNNLKMRNIPGNYIMF